MQREAPKQNLQSTSSRVWEFILEDKIVRQTSKDPIEKNERRKGDESLHFFLQKEGKSAKYKKTKRQ